MTDRMGKLVAAFFSAAFSTDTELEVVSVDYHFNHERDACEVYFSVGNADFEVAFYVKTKAWTFEGPDQLDEAVNKEKVDSTDAAQLFTAVGEFLREANYTALQDYLPAGLEGYYQSIEAFYGLKEDK